MTPYRNFITWLDISQYSTKFALSVVECDFSHQSYDVSCGGRPVGPIDLSLLCFQCDYRHVSSLPSSENIGFENDRTVFFLRRRKGKRGTLMIF